MMKLQFPRNSRVAAFAVMAALTLAPIASGQTALPPPGSTAPADARQDQIEELQAQLQAATSDNEKLQHDLMDARREVARLEGIVSDLTAANASAVQGAPDAQPNADGAKPSGQLGTISSGALPEDAPTAYQRARGLLVADNYPEAEIAFSDFLRVHPEADAETTREARYWLALTLLARDNYTDAASNFVDYLRRYPNSSRSADAQVRLGMALAGLQQTRQACAAFANVPTRYPRSPQAVRDNAARQARALHCAA